MRALLKLFLEDDVSCNINYLSIPHSLKMRATRFRFVYQWLDLPWVTIVNAIFLFSLICNTVHNCICIIWICIQSQADRMKWTWSFRWMKCASCWCVNDMTVNNEISESESSFRSCNHDHTKSGERNDSFKTVLISFFFDLHPSDTASPPFRSLIKCWYSYSTCSNGLLFYHINEIYIEQ